MNYVGRADPASGGNASVHGDLSTGQDTALIPDSTATAEITPQVVAVIQEAVAAYFGRRVRILSVKVGSEPAHASKASWIDRGREIIHGSHNLVQRGR